MASFQYEVLIEPGRRQSGAIEAESSALAVRELLRRGYHVLQIEPARERRAAASRAGLRLGETARLTRQLTSLIRAGVPLMRSLAILDRQSSSERVRRTLKRLQEKVRDGQTFSAALEEQPETFSRLYASLVRAGEAGGDLELVLDRLAGLLRIEVELRARIRAALAYPAMMIVVAILTVFALLTFVIPKISALFVGAGRALPLPTTILMSASGLLSSYWWAVILAAVLGLAIARSALSTERGRLKADRWILRLPLAGPLLLKTDVSRLCRVLGTLTANGLPMLQALAVTSTTMRNRELARRVEAMAEGVKEGQALSLQLEKQEVFPPMVAQVAAVGEESGSLDETLLALADEYDGEINRSIETLVSLLEPIMIVGVGCFVALIVYAMMLPILDLNDIIQ